MRVCPLLGLHALGILGCGSSGGDGDRDPSDYTSSTGPDHCGDVTGSEEWAADLNPHTISCSVYVEGGSVTVRPGTVVQVANDAGLYVSYRGERGGLVLDGTASDPVVFEGAASSERGAWSGIAIYDAADDAQLSFQHAEISGAGGYYTYGNIHVEAAEPVVSNVVLSRSEEAGFYFTSGARFADGSSNITVLDSAQSGAMAADNADSFPEAGADLGDNDDPRIWLGGGDVVVPVTWGNPGVAYALGSSVYLEGTANTPAVLTVQAGVQVEVANDVGIYLSYRGGASGLVTEGTAADPVLFTAAQTREPGAWSGIGAYDAVDDDAFRLAHTTVEYGGGYYTYGNIDCHGANPTIDNVALETSEEAGFYFTDGARFADGSIALTCTGNAQAGSIGVDGADSVPEPGAALTGNDWDVVYVQPGDLTESATWGDLGVPYAAGTIYLEGTGANPTVLTLEAGTTLAFTNDAGLYVSYRGGAAALVAEGTEVAPVTFTAAEFREAGAWSGISMDDATVDAQSSLAGIVVEFGGGYYSYGNIHLDDASPTIAGATITASEEGGIYLGGDASPAISDTTYARNGSGTLGP